MLQQEVMLRLTPPMVVTLIQTTRVIRLRDNKQCHLVAKVLIKCFKEIPNLANVGNMVAAALDPFGINVQVDVEAPNGQRTTCQTTNSSMTTSSESSEGQKDENQEKESELSVAKPD